MMEKPRLLFPALYPFSILSPNLKTPEHTTQVNIQEVLIFKTDVKTKADKLQIRKSLDKHPLVLQWNIDLDDVDCVLRVVSKYLTHNDITNLITQQGYHCEELA
ncbi:hypothetical protein [Mucilaginibacter paludis]|uniref:HMA domain-containing protein n=1 Tax=Mucilaginibacter paludis DSM 18603 TaxID=714943 RepID=H1Y794_9SPHI|nr:hypothetical protein [Mucilaginibacter paludis]EHQ28981.1 hypothetical protein Mucpa_4897 [Mucilaginibacter paludis DSM 18603]